MTAGHDWIHRPTERKPLMGEEFACRLCGAVIIHNGVPKPGMKVLYGEVLNSDDLREAFGVNDDPKNDFEDDFTGENEVDPKTCEELRAGAARSVHGS